MTLTEFLLARIAEDEAVAQKAAAAAGYSWEHEPFNYRDVTSPVDVQVARHDPARVLAECEAKRRIVDNATNMHTSGPEWDEACRILATIYADHESYDESWRP